MAFVRLACFPEATQAHYDAVATQLHGDQAAPGRLLFAAGPVRGGWQVVQVWSSKDHLDVFNNRSCSPRSRPSGARPSHTPPVVTDFEPVAVTLRDDGRRLEGAPAPDEAET